MKHKEQLKDTENEVWFSSLVANDKYIYNSDKAYEHFCERKQSTSGFLFSEKKLLVRFAAVVLLMLTASLSFWIGEKKATVMYSDIIIESPMGSKTKLFLPDGSMVWLNAGSKITYSQGFGIENRSISLIGEAYFDVRKNKDLPFKVNTKELNVSVLGTKFNFKNYESDNEVSVNLIEGKVELQNCIKETDNQFLDPTEMMVLNKQNGDMIISKMETKQSQDWINDRLYFDEMRLVDITKTLERSYNIKVIFDNPESKEIKFHAMFNKREQSISDVFDILKKTGKFEYKLNGDTITIIDNTIK